MLKQLVNQVISIARETAIFIRKEREDFSQKDVRFKSEAQQDLVSYVDEQTEERLIQALSRLETKAGFISEERHPEYKSGLNWIIDPIDGTTNFVHGIPHYAISIALAQDKDLLLGVVLEVSSNKCFHTVRGGDSFQDETVIRTSTNASLKRALLSTGFSVKSHDRLDDNLKLLGHWIENSRGIRRMGSAALDLCYVANGVFDGYYETGLKAWDVAAGALIVQNAGGKVTDFSGTSGYLFGSEIMASNGELHSEIQSQINTAIA